MTVCCGRELFARSPSFIIPSEKKLSGEPHVTVLWRCTQRIKAFLQRSIDATRYYQLATFMIDVALSANYKQSKEAAGHAICSCNVIINFFVITEHISNTIWMICLKTAFWSFFTVSDLKEKNGQTLQFICTVANLCDIV